MAFGEQRGYVSPSKSEVLDPLSRLREDLGTAATAGGASGTEGAQASSLSIGNRSAQRPALVHSNVVRNNVAAQNIRIKECPILLTNISRTNTQSSRHSYNTLLTSCHLSVFSVSPSLIFVFYIFMASFAIWNFKDFR